MGFPRIPGTKRAVTTIANGPNPLAVAYVAALDAQRGLGVAGRLGTMIVGMTGNAYSGQSYRGDLGPLQQFRGWSGPNFRGLLPGAPMGLPITATGDPAAGPFKAP